MRFLLVIFLSIAGSAHAQGIAEGIDLDSNVGRISIVETGDDFSRVLQVDGRRFFEDDAYRYVSVVAQFGEFYLISLSSGGTNCGAEYVWLNTSHAAPIFSDLFGNCSDLWEASIDGGRFTVILPAVSAADGYVAFVYDGQIIEKVALGQRSAGIGLTADDWIGHRPGSIFRDADWRETLIALMGEGGYKLAGDVIAVGSGFEIQGDWVAGAGFNRRMVGHNHGAVAVNRTDGRVVVALQTDEAGLQIWGDIAGSVPEAIEGINHRH